MCRYKLIKKHHKSTYLPTYLYLLCVNHHQLRQNKFDILGFRGLWIMMEGGLMKHFCKGTSTKMVEEYDEKIDKLLKVRLSFIH